MKRKIYQILLIALMIGMTGLYPVFAQQAQDDSDKQEAPAPSASKPAPAAAAPAAPSASAKKGTAKGKETVININSVSDNEFSEALENAKDIELVNEGTAKPAASGTIKRTAPSGTLGGMK